MCEFRSSSPLTFHNEGPAIGDTECLTKVNVGKLLATESKDAQVKKKIEAM
jgi:hypothetical protein